MFSVDCQGFSLLLYRFCVFVQTATCHSMSRCCNLNSSLSTKTSGVHTDKSQASSLMCTLLCVRRLVSWLSACLLASWIWLCIDDNSSRYLFRNRRHCRCALTSFLAPPRVCVSFFIYIFFLVFFLLPLTPLGCFSVVQVEVYLISENSVNDLAG